MSSSLIAERLRVGCQRYLRLMEIGLSPGGELTPPAMTCQCQPNPEGSFFGRGAARDIVRAMEDEFVTFPTRVQRERGRMFDDILAPGLGEIPVVVGTLAQPEWMQRH